MNAVHNPLITLPLRACHTPATMKRSREPAGARGDQNGAAKVFIHSPNDGTKPAAPVEGEPRNEVEQPQEAINDGQVLGNRQGCGDIPRATAPKGRKSPPARNS